MSNLNQIRFSNIPIDSGNSVMFASCMSKLVSGKSLGGVWFGCFLFSFSLKTENGDENVFGLISENIFNENENSKQLENENKKFSFSVFSVENRNLILVKMNLR